MSYFITNCNSKKIKLYFTQSIIAAVLVSAFFLMMHFFQNGLVVTSLIASVFIVFIFPKSPAAQPRNLLGGHLISAAVGFLFYYVNLLFQGPELIFLYSILFCGLAVFLSTLLMALFGCAHPPGAAFAAGFVLSASSPILMCILALSSVFVLFVSKKILMPYLDLDC